MVKKKTSPQLITRLLTDEEKPDRERSPGSPGRRRCGCWEEEAPNSDGRCCSARGSPLWTRLEGAHWALHEKRQYIPPELV